MNELQGTVNDVVNDCCSSIKTIKHEVRELSAKLSLTIRVMGNQPVLVLGVIEFRRAKVPKPRHYEGTHDAKEVENFLFNMEQYFRAM